MITVFFVREDMREGSIGGADGISCSDVSLEALVAALDDGPGFTHNIFLDVLRKGGHMDLAMQVMSEMLATKILPNVVTYSTLVDGEQDTSKCYFDMTILTLAYRLNESVFQLP